MSTTDLYITGYTLRQNSRTVSQEIRRFSCLFESTTESAFPDYIHYRDSPHPETIELTVGGAEFFATEPLASPVLDGEVSDLWITSIYVGWSQFLAKVGGSSGMLGDVNWDFRVNGSDVRPFVHKLLNGPYDTMADMNEDGQLNGLDVDPFVAAVLRGGGAQAIPEPSTLLLVVVALGVAGGWRKWKRAA